MDYRGDRRLNPMARRLGMYNAPTSTRPTSRALIVLMPPHPPQSSACGRHASPSTNGPNVSGRHMQQTPCSDSARTTSPLSFASVPKIPKHPRNVIAMSNQ